MRVDSDLQLMLSIGKLTHLAQMQEDATVDESMLDGMCIAIDSKSTNQILMTCYQIAFHDGLDFVSVHEALTDELKSVVASVPGKQSLDRQVETILQKKASTITDKKVYPLVCLLKTSTERHRADCPADIQTTSSVIVSRKGAVCRGHR